LLTPNDVEARGRMQFGAALAGMAIENSMLGAAHAAANPLTAHCGIVHGQAVGMMLPAVVRFNGADPQTRRGYAELASAPEIASASGGHEHAWRALIARLDVLLDLAHIPRTLAEYGLKKELIPMLAEEASRQWTAGFNPVALSVEDFAGLYQSVMGGVMRET
jgi:alcohol dehydrogenase